MEINNLTILIIAKNEEDQLPDCLKSIGNFAKIILLDTGSSDKTVEIAKKHGCEIIKYLEGKNFSDWRNKAYKQVDTEWFLYLDADERLTVSLKKELGEVIAADNFPAFAIPRKNIILGKELIHGGWYPDYQKRLYKKDCFESWKGDLHEEPIFKGQLSHLKNPMLHNKHENFSQMIDKTNTWSVYEARLMLDANHPPMNKKRFISAMCREFSLRMIKNKAFLDGRVGVMFALYQVFSRFVSYSKLWEMQINLKNK